MEVIELNEELQEVSYTKYDLKSGSTYFFKVRAYAEVDGKKSFSAYTD